MNPLWPERIGVRLGLAVAAVLLLLALATMGLSALSFERAARRVQEESAAALDLRARESLLEITEREAQVIASSLERAAAASRSAARQFALRLEETAEGDLTASVSQVASGHWLDPAPNRRSTLHVPRPNATRPDALRDASLGLALDDILESLAPELGDGVGIYWVTPDGVTRYHPPIDFAPLVEPDFDPTVQEIYRLGTPEANPERQTRWTAPYLDDVGNGLLVTVVTPVYANGAFRGVLDVDVSLDRLARRLANLAPLPGSFVFLIDPEGRLITASAGATRRLGYENDLAFGARLDALPLDDLLAGAREGRSGVVTLEPGGEPLVLAQAPLPEIGWHLVIGAPVSTLNAPAARIAGELANEARLAQRGNVAASAIAFLAALGILVVASRRWVVRPISVLTLGTRRVGAGEFGALLPPGLRGEFRVLGESFNRMSLALAEQRDAITGHQVQLERELAERTRELGNLLAISADLGTAADVPSLVRSVLIRLRNAVPFTEASVWLVDDTRLHRIVAIPGDAYLPPRRTAELNLLLEPLERGGDVRCAHLLNEEVPTGLFSVRTDAALLFPLTRHGRLLGVLALADLDAKETQRTELVAAIAQQLGAAIENARLLVEARERSALEERQHLARELHDSVSQALFGVVLGLQTAQKSRDNPERVRDAVAYASELAEAALKEMRALIFELRPEALEIEGLLGLLKRQAEMLRFRHGLTVELEAVEPCLPIATKAVLYRVVQEAVHNVVKHAAASRVVITLLESGDAVRLEVRDDGHGFSEAAVGGESFGLRSMRERLLLLGGRLEVRSGVGRGTVITAHLLRQAETELQGTPPGGS